VNILPFLITCLVTAVSLVIISKLPLGVEVDSFAKAAIAGLVFGVLNAFVKPVLFWVTIPFTFLTLGLFLLVLNAFIFGLAAWLVEGFRLRWGLMSAFLGAIALSLINSILSAILERVFPNLA
jgi:putative membrane protein